MARKPNPMMLIGRKVRDLRKNKKDEIAREHKWIDNANREWQGKLPELAADLTKIAVAGLLTQDVIDQIDSYSVHRCYLMIDRNDLPRWRAAGKLSAFGKEFDKTDATGQDWIIVTVAIEGLSLVRIRYRRPLPSGSSCRVEEQIQTYKSKVLTCDRPSCD